MIFLTSTFHIDFPDSFAGPGMKGGPYKLLKSIRVWRSFIGDEGAAAIAEVLRLGGAEVQITYLELFGENRSHERKISICFPYVYF